MLPTTLQFFGLKKTKNPLIPVSHYFLGQKLGFSIFNFVSGALLKSGWIESKINNSSIVNSKYVPWITFSALNFLDRLYLRESSVVEFGSGASTAYFAEKSSEVSTFEFDSMYFQEIALLRSQFSDVSFFNVEEITSSEDQNLDFEHFEADFLECAHLDLTESAVPLELTCNKEFINLTVAKIQNADLIFVDGGPRNTLMHLASEFARSECLIVVDNSDLSYTQAGITLLKKAGFLEIPFQSFGPLNPNIWTTSFFIKDLNALKKIYK